MGFTVYSIHPHSANPFHICRERNRRLWLIALTDCGRSLLVRTRPAALHFLDRRFVGLRQRLPMRTITLMTVSVQILRICCVAHMEIVCADANCKQPLSISKITCSRTILNSGSWRSLCPRLFDRKLRSARASFRCTDTCTARLRLASVLRPIARQAPLGG